MARITPRPPPTQTLVLSCLNQRCPVCEGPLWFVYENARKITTLDAVIGVTLQVRRCVTPACEFYHRPYRPESEGRLALPHHEFGLDIMAWRGAQRYQAYCSLPEIHRDLQAQGVVIAARTVDHLLARYEELVSVAVEAPARRAALRQQGRLILALDGLQPDKGQEVLWVIREVLSGEMLAARSLLVSSQAELSDLLREAWVGLEGIPVKGVISDGQLAVRQAVAQVLPGVPHQLCSFITCAKPVGRFGKLTAMPRKNYGSGCGGSARLSGRLRRVPMPKRRSRAGIVRRCGGRSAIRA